MVVGHLWLSKAIFEKLKKENEKRKKKYSEAGRQSGSQAGRQTDATEKVNNKRSCFKETQEMK